MATSNSYFARPSYLYLGQRRDHSLTADDTFEFDESDVWNTNQVAAATSSEIKNSIPTFKSSKKPLIRKMAVVDRSPKGAASLPVNIPDWSKILRDDHVGKHRRESDADVDDEEDDDHDGRIPPHEYLARTRRASLSVHEGIGRTLKGRDLSRVRNAIWKKTGYEA